MEVQEHCFSLKATEHASRLHAGMATGQQVLALSCSAPTSETPCHLQQGKSRQKPLKDIDRPSSSIPEPRSWNGGMALRTHNRACGRLSQVTAHSRRVADSPQCFWPQPRAAGGLPRVLCSSAQELFCSTRAAKNRENGGDKPAAAECSALSHAASMEGHRDKVSSGCQDAILHG